MTRSDRHLNVKNDVDNDPFLQKYLPGEDAYHRELRSKIREYNEPDSLELVRFITILGPRGAGKNHFARVCAGHRRWLQIQSSPDLLDPSLGLAGDIAPLDKYMDRFGEQVMSALPENIAESLLFGHVKGAFSDASKDHPGLFGDPGYDDILLDEIGDTSITIQAKLLAILEGRPFKPIGGTSERNTNSNKRIMMATNQDFNKLLHTSNFRRDLFDRLNKHVVTLKSLKDNPETIARIAESIIDRLCPAGLRKEYNGAPSLSMEDKKWLSQQ